MTTTDVPVPLIRNLALRQLYKPVGRVPINRLTLTLDVPNGCRATLPISPTFLV